MIADAYGYAESGGKHHSHEMQMYLRIQKYGVHAVIGRPVLYEREMRRISAAQNVINAYQDRAKAINWTAYLSQNPDEGNLLNIARELYERRDDTSNT